MGIPNQFNDIIQRHLNIFAAWVPIVNNYSLGDYGVFADGVFSKLGNIKDDFNVDFQTEPGTEASIDFTSESASVVKIGASGTVDVIPAADVKAKVELEFKKEKSFLVKSPTITVTNIKNVNAVGSKLKALDAWDGKWKVVFQVYNASEAIIISTIEAGTKLNFTGDVSALNQLKFGSVGVNVDTNKTLGLKINGKSGIIGIGLFRVRSKVFGGMKIEVLSDDANKESVILLDAKSFHEDDV